MEVILAAIAAACYFYGSYPLAFWLIAVAMFYSLLVLLKSISRPSWYTQQRAKAGLEDGKGFGVLLITKIAILAVLSLGAIRTAELAGYDRVGNQIASLCPDRTQSLFKSCAAWMWTSQRRP